MVLQVFVFGEGFVAFAAQKLREMLLHMLIVLEAIIKNHIATLLANEFLLRVVKCVFSFEMFGAPIAVILLQMAFQMEPKQFEIRQRRVTLVAQENF